MRNTSGIDRTAFQKRKGLLSELANRLKEQGDVRIAIRQAVIRRRETGKASDRDYFSRLQNRERQLPFEISRLQAEIAACGKPVRDSVRFHFMEVAKERLSPELFESLRSEARERATREVQP